MLPRPRACAKIAGLLMQGSRAQSLGRPSTRRATRQVAAGAPPRWAMRLLRLVLAALLLTAAAWVGTALLLDPPEPTLQPSDAVVVISGDEQLARFQEGVNLFQKGYGKYLVFSGAAYDNGTSNADVMREMAIARGIPGSAILDEPLGEDTWGNAIYTRQVLEQHGLTSAILVTSPYHLQRAKLTFDAAYADSGIRVSVHAAPDSEWRKQTWWQRSDTRRLTFTELQKLAYILVTGQYH